MSIMIAARNTPLRRSPSMVRRGLLMLLLTLLATPSITWSVASERIGRPMHVHRVAELNLEIWTEVDPEWETRLEHRNGQPIFAAETPALTYPPAGMTWISVRTMKFAPSELREGARGAIHAAARNYGLPNVTALTLHEARYGDLVGYQSKFTATANATAMDVLVFFGHQPGKPAVLAHAYTLQGKLDHISEHIRRSWAHLRYLK